MWPLRPTAIATPGATASSIETLTILSSLAASEVSRPELLSPITGSTYLIGVGGGATTRAGAGGAHATGPTRAATTRAATTRDANNFIEFTSGSGTCVRRLRKESWAAAKLAGAR